MLGLLLLAAATFARMPVVEEEEGAAAQEGRKQRAKKPKAMVDDKRTLGLWRPDKESIAKLGVKKTRRVCSGECV